WLYRCYAIERLADLTGNVWLAGLLSLLAFSVVHLPFWGVGPALTTLISGSILTVVYIKTRDITALIVAHVAVDLVGLVLMG
ncbi:MAG: CPBP family glutamic-type intramembrane protease, partial [Pseudomonadota bacterium]